MVEPKKVEKQWEIMMNMVNVYGVFELFLGLKA